MSARPLAPWLDEGLALCQAGALQEAEALYRQLTDAYPEAADGWNMLAMLLCQRGALDEAMKATQRATTLRPGIAPYWLTLGNVAMARQMHDEAQAAFRRAIRIDPTFAVAHYRLGLSYHRQLAHAGAAEAYKQALRYAPDVAEIHAQLAEAYVSLDRWEQAMQAYEEAFRRDPAGELDRRGGFECLQRLDFETLPAFWYAEILRFFRRQDIDRKPYVTLALKVLETKPSFRSALRGAQTDDDTLREIESDELFQTLLCDCLIPNPRFERLLTRLRTRLLADAAARARTSLDFLAALALQCFINEYVYAESDEERAGIDALSADVETRLAAGTLEDDTLRAVAVLGAYRPLYQLAGAQRLLREHGTSRNMAELARRSVHDMMTELRLRPEIPAIVEITEGVSQAVRRMYEEHPYPRWFFLDREPPFPLSEWLARELPVQPVPDAPVPVRVLVAGCGTGKDAIWLAANIADAQVLGVDLSRASLAHAQRMASELGVNNVQFRHGDILALDRIADRFDLVVSTGVLHHMRDPQAGLRVLTRLVRPGGLLKIGLYSSTARYSVNAARALIAQQGLKPVEPDIRALRQMVFEAPADSPLKELEISNDFYSMSMCRDLLFHIQEHQYDVPQIEALCKDHGLTFLGFSELPREVLGRYRRMFPDDARMDDLAHWHAFEREHPSTFSSMYLLWARNGRAGD